MSSLAQKNIRCYLLPASVPASSHTPRPEPLLSCHLYLHSEMRSREQEHPHSGRKRRCDMGECSTAQTPKPDCWSLNLAPSLCSFKLPGNLFNVSVLGFFICNGYYDSTYLDLLRQLKKWMYPLELCLVHQHSKVDPYLQLPVTHPHLQSTPSNIEPSSMQKNWFWSFVVISHLSASGRHCRFLGP